MLHRGRCPEHGNSRRLWEPTPRTQPDECHRCGQPPVPRTADTTVRRADSRTCDAEDHAKAVTFGDPD